MIKNKLNIESSNVIMIGNDPILDSKPAKKVGFKTVIIKRNNFLKDKKLSADLIAEDLFEVYRWIKTM